MLTRAQILERQKKSYPVVKVDMESKEAKEEIGDFVYLKKLDGGERSALLVEVRDPKKSNRKEYVHDQVKYAHYLIGRSLCDEKGNRLFTSDDLPLLKFGPQVVEELQVLVMRMSGLLGEEGKNS